METYSQNDAEIILMISQSGQLIEMYVTTTRKCGNLNYLVKCHVLGDGALDWDTTVCAIP